MDCGGRSFFATPARRVAEKLAPSVFVALRRDKSLSWAQGKIRFDCNRWMDCGGRSGFATPARRVAEKLAPSVSVALRRDKSLRWAPARRVAEKLAPSLRWAQGKTAMRPCRLDLATVRQGSIATGGWIAEEGRVLRRVRNRSVLCTRLLRRRSKARDYPQAATAG